MASKKVFKSENAAAASPQSLLTLKMKELVTGNDPNFVLGDKSYGKSGVKILHVSKNGKNSKYILSLSIINNIDNQT